MGACIKVIGGDVRGALKKLKNALQRDGWVRDMRRHAWFQTRAERRRQRRRASDRKRAKAAYQCTA